MNHCRMVTICLHTAYLDGPKMTTGSLHWYAAAAKEQVAEGGFINLAVYVEGMYKRGLVVVGNP